MPKILIGDTGKVKLGPNNQLADKNCCCGAGACCFSDYPSPRAQALGQTLFCDDKNYSDQSSCEDVDGGTWFEKVKCGHWKEGVPQGQDPCCPPTGAPASVTVDYTLSGSVPSD